MTKRKRIVAIIQARLGSTRLPGKTLMTLGGETLLGHLVKRVKASKYVDDIIIATTTNERDDAIVRVAKEKNLNCYRGSENDVLDRFYQAAVAYGVKTIVRVTPDCPILDPEVMDLVIAKYLEGGYNYVSNTIRPSFPDGLDTEVFSFEALEKAWKEAQLASEREHVTVYITKHPELFRIFNVKHVGRNLSHLRWTVDTKRDYDFISKIFKSMPPKKDIFFMSDVLDLLAKNSDLIKINSGMNRNEGYAKSLREDRVIANG
ncbi:MAG: glycosyltransferase family protein [Candidatus Vogelbacteria bacterium]|nr:glycosyltransferase family protein [Candidatus Vogelbacteria bacterium]